jgi:threonine dehydratase
MQRTGSFKFRGALNAIRSALEEENYEIHSASLLHVVTHSSGNHAAAIALASRVASASDAGSSTQSFDKVDNNPNNYKGMPRVKASIVMPDDAPQNKVEAVQDFGGQIVFSESTPLAREEACDRLLQELV